MILTYDIYVDSIINYLLQLVENINMQSDYIIKKSLEFINYRLDALTKASDIIEEQNRLDRLRLTELLIKILNNPLASLSLFIKAVRCLIKLLQGGNRDV